MFNWLFKKRTHLPNSSQKKYHCKFTMPQAAWTYDGLKFGVWPVCTVWDSKQTHTHTHDKWSTKTRHNILKVEPFCNKPQKIEKQSKQRHRDK